MGYSNRTWCCPYFGWDEKLCIHCDAGRLKFPDRKAITGYAERYCGDVNGWTKCTVAQELNRYYERTESNGKENQKRR